MNFSIVKFLFVFVFVAKFKFSLSGIPNGRINIAAIFLNSDEKNPAKIGFEDGIKYANEFILNGIQLNPIYSFVKEDDTYDALNSACDLIEKKSIWALFTSQSLSINWVIPSMANNLFIPNIQSIWDYSNSKKVFGYNSMTNFTINLYPDASLLSQAYKDWTEGSDLKALTIIYERKKDLIYIKDMLELNSPLQKMRISIKEHETENNKYKKILKDSKLKNGDNFVLAVPLKQVPEILRQADELNLITEYNKYLITNLDAFSLNYDFLSENNKNITTLSLINKEFLKDEIISKFASGYKHEEALMFDAVITFAKAIAQLKNSVSTIRSPRVSCNQGIGWESGEIIMRHIKNTMFEGITGPIMFTENGQRVNFTLRILTIQQTNTNFNQTGIWTVDRKIEIARAKKEDVEEDIKKMLKNRRVPLRVVSMVNIPYMFPNPVGDEEEVLSDFMNFNKNYTGFCVELMDKLQERLEFSYDIILLNTSSSKHLLEAVKQQKADIAIVDITITRERQSEVDFTMPFLSLGIATLFSKSSAQTKDLFSFMKPFSLKVWLLLATAMLGVSLVLYIISRISPYEWVSGHPCEGEPEKLENQFSLGNCIWFVLGSIMQQGSDLSPRALSTRLLANTWAFFTLIIVSSYTANLAAVLTLSGLEIEIKSVEDLAKQTKVKYGLLKEGSTHKFFKNSQHPTYQRMYSYMESIEKNEKVYTKENIEGVKRVLKGNFAFLMESTTLEFFTNQHCNLTQIGNLLDSKGYGIVLKQGSPYTSLFSTAILKLQEEQYLTYLRTKWFNQYPAALRQIVTPWLKQCPKIQVSSGGAKEMEVEDVGGVFIVSVVGLIFGILFALVEICWKAKKIARDEREHVLKIIWREFYRILTLGGSTITENPILLPQSNSNQTILQNIARASLKEDALNNDITEDFVHKNSNNDLFEATSRNSSIPTSNLNQNINSSLNPVLDQMIIQPPKGYQQGFINANRPSFSSYINDNENKHYPNLMSIRKKNEYIPPKNLNNLSSLKNSSDAYLRRRSNQNENSEVWHQPNNYQNFYSGENEY